jgi:hypothetical protein
MTAALQTPTALSVPKSGAGGKIANGWLDTTTLFAAIRDDQFGIIGSVDATKKAMFEVDGFTTATTRTFTLPDASVVVAGSAAALTTGRIPFATTGGLLTDSANLTFGSGSKVIGVRRTPHTWGANYGGTECISTSFVEYNDGAGTIQCSFFGNIYDDGAGAFKYAENGSTASFRIFPTSRLFQWATSPVGVTGAAVTSTLCMTLDNTTLAIQSGIVSTFANTTDAALAGTGSVTLAGGIYAAKQVCSLTNVLAKLNITAGDFSSSATFTIKTADASAGSLSFTTATNSAVRWQILKTGTSHALQISAYDSAGGFIDTPINIANAISGGMFLSRITIFSDTTNSTGSGTGSVRFSGGIDLADAKNIGFGTTTGTKIGTATNQKIGFWNVTPVVQPATTGTATGFTAGVGTGVNDVSTFTGGTGATAYRISDIVLALKQVGLLAA